MEEARYSVNIRFRLQGFESQITVREDAPGKGGELVTLASSIIAKLLAAGAVPNGGYNSGSRNGGSGSKAEAALECPIHLKVSQGKDGHLFCPTRLVDGTWCKWDPKKGK